MDTEYKTPPDVVDGIGERVFNSTSPGGGWADDDLGAAFEFGISDPPPPTSNYRPGPQPPKPKNLKPLLVLIIIPVVAVAVVLYRRLGRDRVALPPELQGVAVGPVTPVEKPGELPAAGQPELQPEPEPPAGNSGTTRDPDEKRPIITASERGVITTPPQPGVITTPPQPGVITTPPSP